METNIERDKEAETKMETETAAVVETEKDTENALGRD